MYTLVVKEVQFSSVTQSCLTLCNPMDCSKPGLPVHRQSQNSCPLSWWCHPTISSSVVPFSRLQSFPASGSFQMSRFFTSGGQSIGVSASASVLPMNTQDWSLLGDWLDLLAVQRTLKSLLQHHSSKTPILWCSAFFRVQLSYPCITIGKTRALTNGPFWQSNVSAF